MLSYVVAGMDVVALIASFILLVIAGYHWAMALDDVKPGMSRRGVPIPRRYFATEEGSYYQRRAFIFGLLSICSGGLFAAIIGITGPLLP